MQTFYSWSTAIKSAFFCLAFAATAHANEPVKATERAVKPAAEKPADAQPQVMLETSLGEVLVELDPAKAPASVANFLEYVKVGFYDGVIFHRIIPGFMAQTGGFSTSYQRRPAMRPIVNESNNGLKNLRGTLSMARTMRPDSATSQFFINLSDNANLDGSPNVPGYAVFGKVVKGMEVVDKMAEKPQGERSGPFVNAPNEPIVINKAYLVGAPDADAKMSNQHAPEKSVTGERANEKQPVKKSSSEVQ